MGNGECGALEEEALHYAHAKRGHLVCEIKADNFDVKITGNLNSVELGDIIIYHDVTTKGEHGGTAHAKHHVSIVRLTDVQTREIHNYQQNSVGRKYVAKCCLDLDRMKSGEIKIYQPVASKKIAR